MRYPTRSQYRYAKSPYRIRNWPKYEAGLRSRGDLTVWLSEQLIARHRRGDIPLDPVERDVFGRRLWYFRTTRFERDSTGRVVALQVSGPNTRNILFRRMP